MADKKGNMSRLASGFLPADLMGGYPDDNELGSRSAEDWRVLAADGQTWARNLRTVKG